MTRKVNVPGANPAPQDTQETIEETIETVVETQADELVAEVVETPQDTQDLKKSILTKDGWLCPSVLSK